jgi:hypothetical protein
MSAGHNFFSPACVLKAIANSRVLYGVSPRSSFCWPPFQPRLASPPGAFPPSARAPKKWPPLSLMPLLLVLYTRVDGGDIVVRI